jgi:hypothetical protein
VEHGVEEEQLPTPSRIHRSVPDLIPTPRAPAMHGLAVGVRIICGSGKPADYFALFLS